MDVEELPEGPQVDDVVQSKMGEGGSMKIHAFQILTLSIYEHIRVERLD